MRALLCGLLIGWVLAYGLAYGVATWRTRTGCDASMAAMPPLPKGAIMEVRVDSWLDGRCVVLLDRLEMLAILWPPLVVTQFKEAKR